MANNSYLEFESVLAGTDKRGIVKEFDPGAIAQKLFKAAAMLIDLRGGTKESQLAQNDLLLIREAFLCIGKTSVNGCQNIERVTCKNMVNFGTCFYSHCSNTFCKAHLNNTKGLFEVSGSNEAITARKTEEGSVRLSFGNGFLDISGENAKILVEVLNKALLQ